MPRNDGVVGDERISVHLSIVGDDGTTRDGGDAEHFGVWPHEGGGGDGRTFGDDPSAVDVMMGWDVAKSVTKIE